MTKENKEIVTIVLRNLDNQWYAGYLGKDKVVHYIQHGKTQKELLTVLAREVYELREYKFINDIKNLEHQND